MRITTPKKRMYCERFIDGHWTAVRENGEIAFREQELNSFNCECIDELYNIASVWAQCSPDILGDELKGLLADMQPATLRYAELELFIDKSREGMYGAVTLEALRNAQRGNNDYPSREEFELALNSFAELKIIERDVLDMLGETPEYIDYPDVRIVWVPINTDE